MLVNTSSPSDLIQVATSEGVILGVEKRVTSTLLEASSVEKIVEIDQHIGCAMSGLQADARNLVEHARVECQNHSFHYAEPLRIESCTQAICDLALRFGESGDDEESVMSRPFGVALLIAGYDEDGPQLYVVILRLFAGMLLIYAQQIPRRALGYVLQIRCEGHRVRQRGCAGGTAE
jgi:20S proteasome alpha/beta subunit